MNDTYGHAGGDKVLLAFAHLLQQSLRQTDFTGRYGGEEFMLMLPDMQKPLAIAGLNAIREALAILSLSKMASSLKWRSAAV